MGTFLKLIIALVILNGAIQAGRAALKNYQFEDAVHEAMLFSPNASDSEIAAQAAKLAAEYFVPITADDISVTHRGADIIFSAEYEESITLVPGLYKRTWTFTPTATVRSLRAIPVPRP